MHIAFDIDGTICENSPEMVHDDPVSILQHSRPKHAALSRLVKMIADGHTVSFVTARSTKVQGATRKQLKTWLPSTVGIEVHHRDFEPYEMMQAVVFKFDALRYLTPDLFVGDLPMDQTAAAAAGVPFMAAEWWAKGTPIETVVGDNFHPDAIKRLAHAMEYLDAEQNDGAVLRASQMGLTLQYNRFGLPTGLAESPAHVAGVQRTLEAVAVGNGVVAKGGAA
jgi:hypothetical protein